jgi:hypothetical protein
MGTVSLEDALSFIALVCTKDRPRGRRMAMRWLRRRLDETPAADVEQTAIVCDLLAALGGVHHEEALLSLRAVAESAGDPRPA